MMTLRQPLATTPRERHRQHDRELRDLLADVEGIASRVESERRDLKDDYVDHRIADVRARLAAVSEHLNGAAWLLRGAKNVLPCLALVLVLATPALASPPPRTATPVHHRTKADLYALLAKARRQAAQPERRAYPSQRYICPDVQSGVPIIPTRANILAGICVVFRP